jgi:hypothetical protein
MKGNKNRTWNIIDNIMDLKSDHENLFDNNKLEMVNRRD